MSSQRPPSLVQLENTPQEEEETVNLGSSAIPESIVPKHFQKGLISRHFILQWDNSFNGLAAYPENATWRPLDGHMDIFQSATRYAPGCRKSATRQGNLEQVILVSMAIKKIESNFPCQLGLTVEGAKGNYYCCNGERYAYLIGANEKSHKLNETIVTTNPYVNSEYLRLYPGMTSDKLRSEGIMAVPGENYVFVDKDHPIVEMMNENQEVLQIDLGSAELIDNRWYKVSQAVTERCISELENELVDNLPLMSFNKFNAKIHRMYGRDWDDEDEVCDNVTAREVRTKVMTTNRRATVVVQVTYAYM
jgi:hypothetical protein